MRDLERGGSVKRFLSAAAAFAVASVALCQLSKYKDWAKSPEAYFLTSAEKQEWSKIQSDADAEKFIADYWTRRGGERFKEAVSRRIAAADQQFKMRRQKGSESARGRIFITLGNPSKVVESREAGEAAPNPNAATGVGAFDAQPGPAAVVQTWTYQKDKFDPSWDVGDVQARISVDPQRGTDELINTAQVNKAVEKVVEHSIVTSGAQAAPTAAGTLAGGPGVAAVKPSVPGAATGPAAAAPAPAAAAGPPPAPATAAIPATTRVILEPLLKQAPAPAKATPGFWGGDFQTVAGEPFYAFQIVLPASKIPEGGGVKLAGVVTKEDGQEVSSIWEDAALVDMKRGRTTDKACDRSLVLPAGAYRGAFGLFAPDGGAALVSAAATLTIPEKSSEFRVSPLILASTLTPLTKRPRPTDAFVFGMEKPIRVEPKGNGVFTREDGLWYFYTVSNPVVPAGAPAEATSAPAATPEAGAASPTPAQAPKPRIMTRIGVLKDGKPAFQPATLPAELQPLGTGYYASGSEIPLATFEPGYYTFTLNVRDLSAPRDSVAFKGVDRSGDFVVLMPDGVMPPVPTPVVAKPTPAPKPRPKKG
jgi:GWxTD domain-containing protein